MPNKITEVQDSLPKRIVTEAQLIDSLGFDPTTILR
jgi:hypothetical protein